MAVYKQVSHIALILLGMLLLLCACAESRNVPNDKSTTKEAKPLEILSVKNASNTEQGNQERIKRFVVKWFKSFDKFIS